MPNTSPSQIAMGEGRRRACSPRLPQRERDRERGPTLTAGAAPGTMLAGNVRQHATRSAA
jgi:hypothetical protein